MQYKYNDVYFPAQMCVPKEYKVLVRLEFISYSHPNNNEVLMQQVDIASSA